MSQAILYIQYTNPAAYPPLEHSSRILAKAGWQVLFLGTGSLGANELRFPPHERITVKQIAFSPAGWRQKLHYVQFGLWVLWWTLRWRPDWVYASDLLSCPIVLLLSVLPNVRVIYHEHDSPASSNGSFFQKLSFWARRKLAHRAAMCVLPNDKRAEAFVRVVNSDRNVFTVWNCPRLEEVVPQREPKQKGQLSIYYHGNLSPQMLPATVLFAIAELSDNARLEIIGYETIGHEGYVESLKKLTEQLGIADKVSFLEPMPRHQLWRYMRECDVGVALMRPDDENINLRHLIGASNKLFDYMASGLALLVSDLPDWRQTYVDAGYGLACDPADSQSIAAALQWFHEHPNEMREMGERGRQKILAKWNYEIGFSPILEQMKSSL